MLEVKDAAFLKMLSIAIPIFEKNPVGAVCLSWFPAVAAATSLSIVNTGSVEDADKLFSLFLSSSALVDAGTDCFWSIFESGVGTNPDVDDGLAFKIGTHLLPSQL